MRRLTAVPLSFVLYLMLGCAALGLPSADTFNEKLVVAVSLVTAVRTTATTLLTEGKITANDTDNALKATDAARAGIEVARTLSKTDMTAADSKLTAVRTTLVALQSYLATKKGN